jgi:hypothetical protein
MTSKGLHILGMTLDAAATLALLRAVESGLRSLEHLEFEFDGTSGRPRGAKGEDNPPLPIPQPPGGTVLYSYEQRGNNEEERLGVPPGSPCAEYRRRTEHQLHRLTSSYSSDMFPGGSAQLSRAFFDEEFRRVILSDRRSVPLNVCINDS